MANIFVTLFAVMLCLLNAVVWTFFSEKLFIGLGWVACRRVLPVPAQMVALLSSAHDPLRLQLIANRQLPDSLARRREDRIA